VINREKDEKYSIYLDPPDVLAPDGELLEDNENLNIDKATVISLGGNMTGDVWSAIAMNGLIKHLLGIPYFDDSNFGNRDDVNFYSVNYGKADATDPFSQTSLTTEEIIDLTHRIFNDLIFINDKECFEFESIKENFGKIYFFTHCYGSYVLTQIIDFVEYILQSLSLTNEQVAEILSQITAVNYAPVSIPKGITNINILSRVDEMVDTHDYWDSDEQFLIDHKTNNINIVSRKIVNDIEGSVYINDHNIKAIKRDDHWQFKIKIPSSDLDRFEVYPGGNAECISEIVAHIMCEQIARNIRNEGEEKLTPAELADIAQNIANHYSEDQLAKPITRI